MLDLDVDSGVDRPGRLIGHQARRPQLGQRVGEHELDPLVVSDLGSVCHPILGESGGLRDQPLCRPAAAGGDHETLVAEPGVREAHPVALAPDEVLLGNTDVGELHLPMVMTVCVRVLRHPHALDPGGVHVDEEQDVPPGVRTVGELGLEEDIGGEIGGGHVPFHAVEEIFVADATGRGLDPVDIGPRPFLGYGVALVDVADHRGTDPLLDLVLGRHLLDPRRPGGDYPAQCVGDPTRLLLDQGLGQHRVAGATETLRHVDRGQAELSRSLPLLLQDLGRDLPCVHLGLDFPGDQLVDESAGPFLEGQLGSGEERAHPRLR